MKTFKKILCLLAGICLLMTCSKSDEFFSEDSSLDLKCAHGQNHPNGLDQDRYVTLKSMNLKVHYRIIGKGSVDIVFIPGWTNPLTVYTKQFDYFRDKARCIYIDLPGHGLSDVPQGIQYTMGLMVDAIYNVVKKEGVHKFVAVGFSWGPVPLGQFELKHPGMITKLINLDGGFVMWPPVDDPAREPFIIARENDYTDMLTWDYDTKVFLMQILIPPTTAPADLIEWGYYFPEFPSERLANMNYNYSREEVNQPIGWDMPIMSIYSTEPTDMNYEQLYFPNAEIHVMTGSGHVIQWESAEIVNDLIDDFVFDEHWKKH
jgi:pimeloyl-ACP methyl ester carboxylesterase